MQIANKSSSVRASVGQRRAGVARPVITNPRASVVTAAAAPQDASTEVISARRAVLLGATLVLGAAGLPKIPSAEAAAEGYETFFGFATPPTSYGGYGGNANEDPKYTFEYPTGWKSETPSKVEKGTQGVDGRVVNPRVKGQRAYVITLGRAGEDNKSFKLTDLDSTFQSFAGADYDLQDALSGAAEIKTSSVEVDGKTFFIYDIDSPETRYLSSISVNNGKVFALFVKTPAKSFKANEAKLRHVIETFRLL